MTRPPYTSISHQVGLLLIDDLVYSLNWKVEEFLILAGKTDSNVDLSPSIFKDRRTHGTLALLAWGFFLPVGAILARYLNHKERLWYYLHVAIQFMGFLFGVAAVVVGLSLYHKMHVFFPAHKGIGIFVLVMTILQVCSKTNCMKTYTYISIECCVQVFAFVARPSTDSKYRRYWNWYHCWLGRICLFFGAVNIVLGINIAAAGAPWKIGYGFLLASILVIVIVFETLLRLRRSEEEDKQPAFPMECEISL